MELTNTLLVVIDPTSNEQYALGQALVIAKKMNMNLELLVCDYNSKLVEHKDYLNLEELKRHIDEYLENHERFLQQIAEPLRQQGFIVNYKISWDYPLHEAIIRQAMRVKPFLIVKDTHYHHKFTRAILRNTDWNLIRTCPFPILFTKPDNLWESPTVVSAVDTRLENDKDNVLDKDILQLGKLLSHELNGKHFVYHAYYSILNVATYAYSWSGTFGAIFTQETDQQIRQGHKNVLNKLVDQAGIDQSQIVFEDGEAEQSIPEFINKSNADLLVLGTATKTRFEQAYIGGTTERVLDDIDCDILVMHSPNFITPVSKNYPVLVE